MENKQSANSQLSLAFFLNLLFAIVEFVGGILTNSTAIIADAFHDFMDAIAIGIAVYMDKFSKKDASVTFTYGYRRFSLLSAIIMSSILLIGAVFMIYNGIISINKPKEVNSLGMLGLAILGIIVNGFAFLRIKKGDSQENHNHAHSHSHSHTSHDANSNAIMLHLLEDVLGWIAVLIGAAVMYFTNWFWIDSFLTIAIALFIAYNALKNLLSTFSILMQAVPKDINIEKIKTAILQLNDIQQITALNIWTIDGQQHIATIKVQTNTNNFQEIKQHIQTVFTQQNISNVTIQIDFADSIVSNRN